MDVQPAPLTKRSFIFGFFFAIFMCAVNSYLTLTFGVIEEGPAIAALFFFAFFFLSKSKITSTEMVIVATMGSAGGSLGFIANFFAAKSMTGVHYTFNEMFMFALVSSLIGLMAVIPLRKLLIVMNERQPEETKLPWVGAVAVKGMIDPLISEGDELQPRYLLVALTMFVLYIVFNSSGIGWFPEESALTVFGLSAFGAAICWSPFAIAGSYIMGLRTCFGFLAGAVILLIIAPYLPADMQGSPHTYIWPGVMFLTASGLTALAIHWRVIVEALKSLGQLRAKSDDDDPIMSGKAFAIFTTISITITTLVFYFQFKLSLIIIVSLMVVGGLILNIIATRAAAQTYFNPARVMGILLEGLSAILGAKTSGQIVAGGGMIAGSGAQGGNLTNDMAYGRWYKIPSRWQFWTQALTIIPCCLVSAWIFQMIAASHEISLDGKIGPIAKMWASVAMLLDPSATKELPNFAVESMIIGGIAGVIYTLLENFRKKEDPDTKPELDDDGNVIKPDLFIFRRFMPCSIGIGLGMVLYLGYDFSFVIGGLFMIVVLERFLKINPTTVNTIAIAGIVGEGIGGLLTAILKAFGIITGAGH